jgi:hypothetical protein
MVTVAIRRLPPGVQTPSELSMFRREEWMAHGSSRGPEFRRWQVVRHACVEAHPGSELGDMLDVLQAEVQMWEWVP